MNIEEAIKEASQLLERKKIKSALLDSEILMSKVLKRDRKFLIMNPGHKIVDKDYKNFPCRCGAKKCVGYIVNSQSRWRIKKLKKRRSSNK